MLTAEASGAEGGTAGCVEHWPGTSPSAATSAAMCTVHVSRQGHVKDKARASADEVVEYLLAGLQAGSVSGAAHGCRPTRPS
jgi:hypothetical protein